MRCPLAHARVLSIACLTTLVGPLAAEERVDFDRHVRPILADACFTCHGPDAAARQAELRLDLREGLFAPREGRAVVAPGRPEASELVRRLTAADADQRMPPADAPRRLTPGEIDLLTRWVKQGAPWGPHWALVAPRQLPPPAVRQADWPRGAIDHFVLARLEAEGWRPAEPADRGTLLRRVTLDLTGLPPTLEELDAFLADDRPDAYEQAVRRLLASPRVGERLALDWLDTARYADTNGYQSDGPRQMWRWRDWVIDAFNANQPFDEFTIDQLAGDLRPGATRAQRVATGFNRNHRGNGEGGVIPEEYQVEYVVDRVETTSTAWLGLTIGCARCHEHKYDPVSQAEFYRLFAFFNNIPEHGRAVKEGNSPPFLLAPTSEQQQRWDALAESARQAEADFAALAEEIAAAQRAWEAQAAPAPSEQGWPGEDLLFHLAFEGRSSLVIGETPAAKFVGGEPAHAPSLFGRAGEFDGARFVDAGDQANFGYFDKFTLAAWIRPDAARSGAIVSRMTDVEQGDGYSLALRAGRVQLNLVKRFLDDALRVETEEEVVPADGWTHVLATYDGGRLAAGVRVYVNGAPRRLKVLVDGLNQTIATAVPLRVGAGGGPAARFRGAIDEVRLYARDLAEPEARRLAEPTRVADILKLAASERTPAQADKLRAYFLEHHAPPRLAAAHRERGQSQRRLRDFVEKLPTVMVMEEMPRPRPTRVLARGQYDQPRELVAAGVPACLPPLPDGAAANRLGLALWLVDRRHPLTSRVIVNRYWQMLFGAGLVRTPEDFGTQGERPSHPELLDWLAVEFQRAGWDVKRLLFTIVTSATYRQASAATADNWRRDPDNTLLGRGPRRRLPAELLRDQALAVSGLLSERVGGPSVFPYQPDDLWRELATTLEYPRADGADLYRRGLYSYWKRTVAPPAMTTFDAGARETCVARRPRTNTPLQALALMNETSQVEAARHLAQRVLGEGRAEARRDAEPRGATPWEEASTAEAVRLARAFRLASCRAPRASELAVLAENLAAARRHFARHPEKALELLAVGASPADRDIPPGELAAWTVAASLILNLDEVVTNH